MNFLQKICIIMLVVLLVISAYGDMTGSSTNINSNDLLKLLSSEDWSSAGYMEVASQFMEYKIDSESWGVFAFLANFLNLFIDAFSVTYYVGTMLIVVIEFIVRCVRIMF